MESLFALPRPRCREIALSSAAQTCKNRNLYRVVRHGGLRSLEPLLSWQRSPADLLQLRREGSPVLRVSWHVGPPYAIACALQQMQHETLMCVGPPPAYQAPPCLTYASTEGGTLARAEALQQCLRRLRAGGSVYLKADHPTLSDRRTPHAAPHTQHVTRAGQAATRSAQRARRQPEPWSSVLGVLSLCR